VEKKFVNLMLNTEFIALIIPCESGIEFGNQCGGGSCSQVRCEGILIPLPGTGPEQSEQGTIYDKWSREYDEEAVQKFLVDNFLDEILEPTPKSEQIVEIVHEDENSWGEAWIPVKIKNFPFACPNQSACSLENFKGERAFITYSNSD